MTASGESQLYAVTVAVRDLIVLWPSPIWWRFWEKVERRMGYRIVVVVAAEDAAAAAREAHERVAFEAEQKAKNAKSDPWRIEIESTVAIENPPAGAGERRWFSEPAPPAQS